MKNWIFFAAFFWCLSAAYGQKQSAYSVNKRLDVTELDSAVLRLKASLEKFGYGITFNEDYFEHIMVIDSERVMIENQPQQKPKEEKAMGTCRCQFINDTTLKIQQAMGFFAGYVLKSYLTPNTSLTTLTAYLDGDSVYQYNRDDTVLLPELDVSMQETRFTFKQNPFSPKTTMLEGIFEGLSPRFYELRKQYQLEIRTMFRCRLRKDE